MQSTRVGRAWRRVCEVGDGLPLGSLLAHGPLLAAVAAFYSVQLLSGAPLPGWAHLVLALLLTTGGIFGMRSHSPAVLACIAAGETAGVFVGLSGTWTAVGTGLSLALAATVVPLVARGRITAMVAAQNKLTRRQVTARLQIGERLTKGVTPNPAPDLPNEPVGGSEALVRNALLLAKKSLKCRTALFAWYDEKEDILVPVETLSDVPEILSNATISLKEGRLTALKATRDIVSIRYAAGTQQTLPIYMRKVTVSAVLAVPVTAGGQLAGAFVMDKEGPDPFFLPDNVIARKLADMAEDALKTERRLKSAVLVSEHLRQMIDAAAQFGAARTFEQVYEIVVRYAVSLAPFSAAVLAHRISPSGTEYEIVGVNRKQTTTLLGKHFDPRDTLCGLASRSKCCLPPNYTFERRMPQPFGASVGLELEDGETCALIPLIVKGESVGFLLLAEARKKVVKDDMGPVMLFAEYCAVSLLNAEANKELERMAISDPLTGIPNHRAFSARLLEASQRSDRSQKPMSLLFLDIDHFKSVNDQFGHTVGDVVLRAVANCLTKTMRKVDFAARNGGEEFVCILEETDPAGAMIMAERLRLKIAEMRFDEMGKGRSVTVSIGISTYPKDTKSVEELVALADSALYRSKNDGRNRCTAA